MVAKLLRIRLTYLQAFFYGQAAQKIMSLLLILGAIFGAVLIAWMPLVLARGDAENLFLIDVIFGSVIMFAIGVVPFFSNRWNIETKTLQTAQGTPTSKAVALLVTGFASWPFFWLIFFAVCWIYFRPNISLTEPLTWIAFVLLLLAGVIITRFFASVSSLVFTNARQKKLRNILSGILLLGFAPVAFMPLINVIGGKDQALAGQLVHSLILTPFGAAFGVFHLLSGQDQPQAVISVALAVAALALIAGITISLMIGELLSVTKPQAGVDQNLKLGWFDLFRARPAGAVAARSMIYWTGDSRYRVSLVAVPIIPFLVLAILKFAGVDNLILAFLPLPIVLTMIGWMLHNDVAHDSTAFWLHVASGIRGWQDRLGRLAPVFIIGVPILIVGGGVSVLISGAWELLPSFLAVGFAALTASAAVSSVTSVLLPYPATKPDESPFVQPNWQGMGSGISQTTAFVGAVLLTVPVLWLVFANLHLVTLQQQLAIFGAAGIYGLVVLLLGVLLGGFIYNKRATKVLTLLQVFD